MRAPREQLLHDGEHLGVHAVARGDGDDGQALVHERERAVLHLARQDALAVHQRHLLHLRADRSHPSLSFAFVCEFILAQAGPQVHLAVHAQFWAALLIHAHANLQVKSIWECAR
jgi:hypothetical protein